MEEMITKKHLLKKGYVDFGFIDKLRENSRSNVIVNLPLQAKEANH